MIDFKKHLSGKKTEAVIDPLKLYDTLDRASDKGPLRPAQAAVLEEWFNSRRDNRDVIVKLHTGQGKTLIGLLMLQSRLNEKKGPVLYICPDNFLIDQTCEQAKQFGIPTCTADPDLPDDYLDGRKILVTSVQKLFNGLSRFGLHGKSIVAGTLLMDDAHICSDRIREACRIRLPKEDPGYEELKRLFASELEQQGVGTYADICHDKYDALLPVPYWTWIEHESEVARILSSGSVRKTIKFSWPLLKDMLRDCQCIISGGAIEIEPYLPPLEAFGTYWMAKNRVFMSATVTDDAFLVKGLKLSPDTITNPLTYDKERWSGEKMILIPSLIHDDFDRTKIVNLFGKTNPHRKYGIVALVPSFSSTKDWEACGAQIANKETLSEILENLRHGKYDNTIVLVNRYDGIDLPDETCRILIFDSLPYSESLIDLYQDLCRADSEVVYMRTVRTVEQGLGRSVRGEKDYSVVIITGADLTRLIRDKKSKRFLSSQMATQIEIGLELVEMARQEIEVEDDPLNTFNGSIKQCLQRDQYWKEFYIEQMNAVKPSGPNKNILKIFETELEAEKKYISGDYSGAIKVLQDAIDRGLVNHVDRGWYLQEMARYNYRNNRIESQRLQIAAFNNNRFLLKPPQGVKVAKLKVVSQGRMERIIDWIGQYDNYEQLNVALSDILGQLIFGNKADKFEQALDELSRVLGFKGERPDKEWKEGPDNLWALDDKQYILWECKNEVKAERSEINKDEADQMNRSCAWFEKHYAGCNAKKILVHPSNKEASAAAIRYEVSVMRVNELKIFVKRIRDFFRSFESLNFRDLSASHVQQLIDAHELSISALISQYTKPLRIQK